ncbi:MAG: cell division protein FtsL [Coriobacteriia bacterium]|nr:cell division protein FtsL [Coriobacteriia bacterium]
MSAQPARKLERRVEEAPQQRKKAQVRLVVDHSSQRKAQQKELSREASLRIAFNYLAAVVLCSVVLGLGCVYVNGEATACSQQSILIKQDISDQTAIAQSLELERAKLRSTSRIEQIATKELGMVAMGNDFSTIDIGAAKSSPMVEPAAKVGDNTALSTLANMTAGEASALLVGDISLVSSR